MTKTHHSQRFDHIASWTMLFGASAVWVHNTLEFLSGLVG